MGASVQGIILAGVHQWRDSAFERAAPRSLLSVANRPLIEYVLEWMRDGGVGRQSVCANSDTSTLRAHYGDGGPYHFNISYYEDVMPRGPAGCVRDASASTDSEILLVADATIVPTGIDLAALVAAHLQADAAMTVVTGARAGTRRGRAAPAGVYVISRRALEYIAPDGYQDIKESLIPRLYEAGEALVAFEAARPTPRVTNAETCLAANEFVLRETAENGPIPEEHVRRGQALIHERAQVDDSATLIGPVILGAGSQVERGAIIVGPTAVGKGCTIGPEAMICRSAVWDDAAIGRGAILDRCIVTEGSCVAEAEQLADTVYESRSRRLVP